MNYMYFFPLIKPAQAQVRHGSSAQVLRLHLSSPTEEVVEAFEIFHQIALEHRVVLELQIVEDGVRKQTCFFKI